MPVLRGKNVDAALTLGTRLASAGSKTTLQLAMDGSPLLSESLTLTEDDFSNLYERLREVAERRIDEMRFESTDADLIVEAERLSSPDDIAIRVWYGEPYMFLRGYRIVVTIGDLKNFAFDLLTER